MGMIVVLTLQGSRVLGHIDINDQLSYLQPLSRAAYHKGCISQYDGCIAIGTISGKVLLVDSCLKQETDRKYG